MEYRQLGRTGIEVSCVGLGCYQMGGTHSGGGWPGMDDDESIATIQHAESLGINLLDSAEGYGGGHSETLIGRALQGRRDRYVIATKCAPPQEDVAPGDVADRVRAACDGSLARMRTDYIDVYQLHGIPSDDNVAPAVEALCALQDAGKIRCFGISINATWHLQRLVDLGRVAEAQVAFSLVNGSGLEALQLAARENIGTLIKVPLGQGVLTGKYFESTDALLADDLRRERFGRPEAVAALAKLRDLRFLSRQRSGAEPDAGGHTRTLPQAALRFVLDTEGVTSVIPGAKNRQQLEDNAAASDLAPLTDEERARAMQIASHAGYPLPAYAKPAGGPTR